MPQYTVSGVDREDGGVRFTTVQAASADDAINKAGFIVEKVEPVPETAQAPVVAQEAARLPTYLAIALFATLALVVGYGLTVLACTAIAFSIFSTDANDMLRFGGGVFAIYSIPTGMSIALLGELLRAFRDMARNSFR